MKDDVKRVTVRWDDGWYCEAYDEDDNFLDDSQKVWFPIDTDYYGTGEAESLSLALTEAFPMAEIVFN